MKLQWLSQNEIVDTPVIAFGFDTVDQLISGQLTISWLGVGGSPARLHNLIIAESGVSGEALGKAVIEATKAPLRKHRKGRLTDGTARDVYPIFNDPALPFRAGLTVHAARGTWSSLPHAFEAAEILTPRPMPFFEQFAYVTDPPGGWGVQVRIGHLYATPGVVGSYTIGSSGESDQVQPNEDYYHEWVKDTVIVRDRDILDIPLGSHPASGGPNCRLCYFWLYWGSLEGREKFK